MLKLQYLMISFIFCFFASNAFAQSDRCQKLKPDELNSAQSLMNEIHSYGCCTDSVSECIKKDDAACKTPAFLANEICRLVSKNKKPDEIKETIKLREKAMDPNSKVYTIDVKPEHIWGNPESKTILTVYLCGRCPYCSRHVPLLIHTLEKSNIKDKIAVNLRYFPIKAHENSTPAALAIEAAAQMGHAWDYLIKSYENFDSFSLNQIQVWSKELELDSAKFNELMKKPETRAIVVASKKEGLVNEVTTTPTFFINGRRIEARFDAEGIISMMEEELEGNKHE